MVASILHAFVNPKGDGPDATLVKPSDWNAQHVITGVGLTGKQCIPIVVGAMVPSVTNGAIFATGQISQVAYTALEFSATTPWEAQWNIPMPKSWNEGTITFQPLWSHPPTTINFGVVWELAAVAFSDADNLNTGYGTAQTSIDTGGVNSTIYFGPESAAITVGNSPSTNDLVFFRIRRLPADAADTLAVSAYLHAVKLFITTAEGNDS